MIDFKQLALKLSQPWWGPYPPTSYTSEIDGKGVGVGRIVGQDYGAWNFTLLARGTFAIPTTRLDHSNLVAQFVMGKQNAAIDVRGQPLGSFLVLMSPTEFRDWLACSGSEALGSARKVMRHNADLLIASIAKEGV